MDNYFKTIMQGFWKELGINYSIIIGILGMLVFYAVSPLWTMITITAFIGGFITFVGIETYKLLKSTSSL